MDPPPAFRAARGRRRPALTAWPYCRAGRAARVSTGSPRPASPRLGFRGFALTFPLALCAATAPEACAQALLPPGFSDQLVVSGLRFPVNMAFLPDGRVLVNEKWDARVRLIVNDTLASAIVATIDSVRQTSEGGLMGIAVDPGWPARPYVYLQYDDLTNEIRIARYRAVGDLGFSGNGVFTLDLASRHLVVAGLPDQGPFHNGGTLGFGPDGMLYSSLGDDNSCFSSWRDVLVGKILRLDVSGIPDGPGGPAPYALITPPDNPFVSLPDERSGLVWAYGLRNPFSFDIDEPTGDLIIADVGDAAWEELDLADSPGMNFGYPTYEGPAPTGLAYCPGQDSLTARWPIYAYDRSAFQHGAAVISAGRCRRPPAGAFRFPATYDGDIFLSDVGEGFLRRLEFDGVRWAVAPPVAGQPADSNWALNMERVVDYAWRPDGSLWYCTYDSPGEIRRIVYDNSVAVPLPADERVADLLPPFPTPANGLVTLPFRLAEPARVRLSIHDLAGREVRRLANGEPTPAGDHTRAWWTDDERGSKVRPGIYLARLEAGSLRLARRVIVIR